MSDRVFERAVRDWLEDGSDRTPPPAIDAVLLAVKTTPQERDLRIPRRFTTMPISLRLAVAAVAVLAFLGGGAVWYVGQATSSAAPSAIALPSAASSPTPSPAEEADAIKGWPGNKGFSEPGLYSWGELGCEPSHCLMGVLHRHESADEVRLTIRPIPDPTISDASGTAVTVAGHQGLYLRINPELEEWNVSFDGTLMSITLELGRGVSQEVVDEAKSIIESLVYERRDTPLGFRLVFRLPSSYWDSPY